MGKKLRVVSLFLTVLLIIWGSFTRNSYGQTLSPGDIAFVGLNADKFNTAEEDANGFAIVIFKEIAPNTTIYFTNGAWLGSNFESGAGDIVWNTGSATIQAGTVITFRNITSSTGQVSVGTLTSTEGAFNFSTTGDVTFAYIGSEQAPATFLAAIATGASFYDDTDGTNGSLSGTNLTQGREAILLSENTDNAEYIGNRDGNTIDGYFELLSDVDSNWIQSGEPAPVLPYNTESFVIVNPPTVQFTASEVSINEGSTVTLTVKLTDIGSNFSGTSVDVAFLKNVSSASGADVANYTPQTVTFASSASEGAAQNVTVTLAGDSDYEGQEIAVFQLQNLTDGTIIKPQNLNLIIADDDAPDVVIDEFYPAPGTNGDTNGDGTTDTNDEFIEIVNTTSHNIDISGWQLSDNGTDIKYTYPSGTVLPANGAGVVFSGGKPSGSYGAAFVHTSGGLSLNNSGDKPTLFDEAGNTIYQATYSNSPSDESLTRDQDPNTSQTFVPHGSVSNQPFSPGTEVDGGAFDPDATFAVAIREGVGYRMISSPTQSTSFSDLFSKLWMQGISGSDVPTAASTLYFWNEANGGSFAEPASMSENLVPGKGYFVYVFKDNEIATAGLQGGFPKIVSTRQAENGSVQVTVTASDADNSGTIDGNEGLNLLGNPFGTDISVTALLNALDDAGALNQNVYVYNHSAGSGNGGFEILSDGGQIAPFQGFYVAYTDAGMNGSVTLTRSNLAANQGTVFYDRQGFQEAHFQLFLGNGKKYDSYTVRFTENGTVGEDLFDAYKLFSLKANSINLFSTVGGNVKLAINVLPPARELDAEIRIPIRYQLPQNGEYTFRWDKIDELPREMEVYLIDSKTGSKIDLSIRETFTFTYYRKRSKILSSERGIPLPNKTKDVETDPRFELVIAMKTIEEPGPEMSKPVTLSPNYPNPFRGQTEMTFKLKEPGPVSITIWNIVGQKVATIYDNQMMSEGAHTYYWNADSNLPSGIYICKLEAAGTVLIRKMTLIK